MRGGRRGPWGGQCIANITREDKHRVPLSDNCTWAVSTDLAAVSAPKRLQKQGHCEHQGGVRSTMVSLKITRVSNPKRSRERETKGKEKKKVGERSRKLFQAARGRCEPRCPHTVDTKLPLPLRNKAQRCQSGHGAAASPDPSRHRHPPRWAASSARPRAWAQPRSETGQLRGTGDGEGAGHRARSSPCAGVSPQEGGRRDSGGAEVGDTRLALGPALPGSPHSHRGDLAPSQALPGTPVGTRFHPQTTPTARRECDRKVTSYLLTDLVP